MHPHSCIRKQMATRNNILENERAKKTIDEKTHTKKSTNPQLVQQHTFIATMQQTLKHVGKRQQKQQQNICSITFISV